MTSKRFDFDPSDLTKGALVRLVKQLAVAGEEDEARLLAQLKQTHKETNDLADLKAEKNGAPKPISPDEDDEEDA